MEWITENLPILIISLAYAIDKVLMMLRVRGVDLLKLARQVDELWIAHNAFDIDHQRSWYSRFEMLKKIVGILRGIQLHDTAMLGNVKDFQKTLDRIEALVTPPKNP